MKTGRIHLVNPATASFATNPVFFNRALYSPLAWLLAVASLIPGDKYEVVLTDENIQPVDFGLKADLVGISAMTSYVRRGYEIADAFRRRGLKVIMPYSLLTPYPGTLTWFEMLRQNRIRCCDWDKYDQGNVVYQPKHLTAEQLVEGHLSAYRRFYSASSIFSRFPRATSRSKLY